jgi:PAS domain S-box-containing protein
MFRPQEWLGYVVAAAAAAGVLWLRVVFNDHLEEQARLLPFVIAVMLAARVGGLWPGLLATFLAAILALWFVVPPNNSLHVETLPDGLNLAIFIVVGVTISIVFERLHAVREFEKERQFHLLADSVAQLVWMADPVGERVWFNQRWYDYTGTTIDSVRGSGWLDCCEPADVPQLLNTWQAALGRGVPWEDTYRLRGRDGQFRWFLARAIPVKNQHGQIVHWFGTSTDIHDRIEMEHRLIEADGRKDRYLAMLAHELRNPLAPISNALQFWPRVANDPQEMEQIRKVMSRQTRQLVRLVDDLLDVSRISQGKIVLRKQPVDLRSIVQQAVEAVLPLIESRQQRLQIALPEEPVVVEGDRVRLLQVFSNLLNNAAKFSPERGCIELELDRAGSESTVRVRDHGRGLAAKQLDKIFEPFYQVNRTIDSSQGGLGIGLTLARQLVALHGGALRATSPGPGQGSEFVVTLSVLTRHLPQVAAPHEPGETPLPALQVLVVDDLMDSADTLVDLLRAHGHQASARYDGVAAIDWVQAHHPQVVLLDVAMPGLDGYEVARRIRLQPSLPEVRLIALTGFGQPSDKRKALAAGFAAHLTKPVDWKTLERTLRHVLAAAPAEEEPVTPVRC